MKKEVEAALATHCGFDVDVVVRTKAQLDKVVAHDPFAGKATDRARYLVVFLEKAPPASWRRAIDAGDHEPDEVAVHGKEIYLWLPQGRARQQAGPRGDRQGRRRGYRPQLERRDQARRAGGRLTGLDAGRSGDNPRS